MHDIPTIWVSVDLILLIYVPGKSLKFEQVAIPAALPIPRHAHRLAPEPHLVRYHVQYSYYEMRLLSAGVYLAMLFRDPVGVVNRWLHLRLVGHRECDLQNLNWLAGYLDMLQGFYIVGVEIRTNAQSLRLVLYSTHGLSADWI